jgi:hypothetical protein
MPRLDLLQTAKALRCYADVLSLIAGATSRPEVLANKKPA